MRPLAKAFAGLKAAGRKGFIPFVTAGDPDLAATSAILLALADAGSTAIELGVPFSDPMADGPTIQRASERALRHGFGLAEILKLVAEFHARCGTPIVLFSYFNPLLQYGTMQLARDAAQAGVSGILVTDLPLEESATFAAELDAQSIDLIQLVAPTSTDDRLRHIAERARGFLYAVSRTGVTGTQDQLSADARALVERLRKFTSLPVALGFGVSRPEHAQEAWRYADAVVVGSAIVAEIEAEIARGGADVAQRVAAFARQFTSSSSSARA